MTNKWYSPAKIYGQLYKDDAVMRPESPGKNMTEEQKTSNKVSISENGEAVLAPDVAKVFISYKSVKVNSV